MSHNGRGRSAKRRGGEGSGELVTSPRTLKDIVQEALTRIGRPPRSPQEDTQQRRILERLSMTFEDFFQDPGLPDALSALMASGTLETILGSEEWDLF
jgi:hypothetical protein